MIDEINKIINKYTYSCNKKIKILTDDTDNPILKSVLSNYNDTKLGKLTDNFSEVCMIIIKYKVINGAIIKFMNDHTNIKILLIVNRDFDFNKLVKESKANSIDAFIIKNNQDYFIILSNQ
ncbi:hypothetical protein Indivirus_1_235 [Indivirus ILV1]|uniref:Uncharacterized protein n=1 Tax=Indivirus ILV1 TaxID=1977633 RepID=A0A1V0SD27_9VIRU|nr:hypothetical protein Indivirus_1_235 [Indivirus ILV1]